MKNNTCSRRRSGTKITHRIFQKFPQFVCSKIQTGVKIICTRKRNQVKCLQIISNDLLLCKQNCTIGWELDDHRFQSKLVIIPFFIFSYCGQMAEAMDNILQNIPSIGSGRF